MQIQLLKIYSFSPEPCLVSNNVPILMKQSDMSDEHF